MLLASSTLALPSAQLGAPSDATGLEARSPELHAKGSGLSIDDINRFYDDGHPSNDMEKVGLWVHQHDNTEAFGRHLLYMPGDNQFQEFFAGSIINRDLPALYNDECGIIVAPAKAKVLCSFYVDFTSWNTGCETGGLLNIFGPDKSWSRNNPFPGDELKDMMEVSKMLQGNGRKDRSELHVAPGGGMPNMTNNKYNEVLIDSQYYQKALPGSVAAVFYVENGDPAGPECAEATHTALVQRYGLKDDDVLLLAHSQGATPAFSKLSKKKADDTSGESAGPKIPSVGCVAVDTAASDDFCQTNCPLGNCPEALCVCAKEKDDGVPRAPGTNELPPAAETAQEQPETGQEAAEEMCPGKPNVHLKSKHCPSRPEGTQEEGTAAAAQPKGSGGERWQECYVPCGKTPGKCFDKATGKGFCGAPADAASGGWSGSCCRLGATGDQQAPECGIRGCANFHCCVEDADPADILAAAASKRGKEFAAGSPVRAGRNSLSPGL